MLHNAIDMPWPLSRSLLLQILEDRCSDRFVCERIWERLGYRPAEPQWCAGPRRRRIGRMPSPRLPS